MAAIARHRFVRLDPGTTAEPATPDGVVDGRLMSAVDSWIGRGLPLVVRRRGIDDPAGSLPLALTLPARLQRLRLALRARSRSVRRVDDPPLLRDALSELPVRARAALRELDEGLEACGVTVRVYGSLAWQCLTGERYLHDGSDVDLLLEPGAGFDVDQCRRLLRRVAAADAPRLDGEIVLDRGDAASWREWCGASRRLLVKGQSEASLVSRAEIEARLAAASVHAGMGAR